MTTPPGQYQPAPRPRYDAPVEETEEDAVFVAIPRRTLRRFGIAALVAFAVLVVVFGFINRQMITSRLGGGLAPQVDRGAYQAVFMVGSQLYFGHLRESGNLYLLSDVYYIADASSASSDAPASARGQLIKRGNEVHGPRDPMLIPASQVLFIENMRDDSDVVKAIVASKANGSQPPPVTPPQPTATPTTSATPTRTPTATPTAPR